MHPDRLNQDLRVDRELRLRKRIDELMDTVDELRHTVSRCNRKATTLQNQVYRLEQRVELWKKRARDA